LGVQSARDWHARLKRQALNQIHDVAQNTYNLKEQFYSCRPSFYQEEANLEGHLACLYLAEGKEPQF